MKRTYTRPFTDPNPSAATGVWRSKKKPRRYRQRTSVERAEWARIRAYLLAVRGSRCERCGLNADQVKALHLHHRWPVGAGGPEFPPMSDWSHPKKGLLILCDRCHKKAHAPPTERAWNRLLEERWGKV